MPEFAVGFLCGALTGLATGVLLATLVTPEKREPAPPPDPDPLDAWRGDDPGLEDVLFAEGPLAGRRYVISAGVHELRCPEGSYWRRSAGWEWQAS